MTTSTETIDTIDIATEIETTLAHFTGTEQYHRIAPKLLITDGVKYLCDKCKSFWLMDIIFSYQSACSKDAMLRDFQIWELEVNTAKGKGVVKCLRDTDDVAIKQNIPYTDFPLKTIRLYCENGVICLPQER